MGEYKIDTQIVDYIEAFGLDALRRLVEQVQINTNASNLAPDGHVTYRNAFHLAKQLGWI